MGLTVEHPATSAHIVQRRLIATLEDGRQIVLHVPGEEVTAARAKALDEHDNEALGVVDFHAEGEDEPKPVEERPRTAKRAGPKE